MERTSFRSLGIKKIPQVIDEAKEFILRRKQGLEPSLKVKSSKINDTFLNGFDWNRIVTVAGLSGAGKSTLVRQLITEMADLNPTQTFEVLSFQFEMLGIDEVARDISARLDKSVKELYSAATPLSDADFDAVCKQMETLSNYNINIVDNPGTVKEIKDTILHFDETYKLVHRKAGLIISRDK